MSELNFLNGKHLSANVPITPDKIGIQTVNLPPPGIVYPALSVIAFVAVTPVPKDEEEFI